MGSEPSNPKVLPLRPTDPGAGRAKAKVPSASMKKRRLAPKLLYQSACMQEILRGQRCLSRERIMSIGPLTRVLGGLRRTAFLQEAANLTDGELLECYVAQRD